VIGTAKGMRRTLATRKEWPASKYAGQPLEKSEFSD